MKVCYLCFENILLHEPGTVFYAFVKSLFRKNFVNQSINQSKTLFNFEFVVDSNIADISEENKSMK